MSAWHKEWDDPAGRVGRGGLLGGGSVPPWTLRLLIANAVVFVVLFMLGGTGGKLASWLGINSGMWFSGPPYVPVWQVLTYGFVHDLGGFGHILFNSLTLFFFGAMLERSLGSNRFLVCYFGALLAGGVLHVLLTLTGLFGGVVVGASGAIMGVVVAAAVLFPRAQVLFIFVPLPLWVMAGVLVAIDLMSFTRMGSGVAHDVHLAGALFGFLYIKRGWYHRETPNFADMPAELAAKRAERKEAKAADQRKADEACLDQLLERINRDGLNSLSDAEKAFLNKMSKRP